MCAAPASESGPTVGDTIGSPHAPAAVPGVGMGHGVLAGAGSAEGDGGSLSVGEADGMADGTVWRPCVDFEVGAVFGCVSSVDRRRRGDSVDGRRRDCPGRGPGGSVGRVRSAQAGLPGQGGSGCRL